jgi:hypothetical protein
MATQTTAFMADYLPNRYEQGDTVAVASVNAFLRNLVKHERTTMRNLVSSYNQLCILVSLCQDKH